MKIDNGNNAVRAFAAQSVESGAGAAVGTDLVAKGQSMVDSWGIMPGGCFPPPYPGPGGDIGRILQQLMQLIQQRARAVIWLNPEPESYWGQGDSVMHRYARFTHVAKPCNTLGQLERIIEDVLRTYSAH